MEEQIAELEDLLSVAQELFMGLYKGGVDLTKVDDLDVDYFADVCHVDSPIIYFRAHP